jgi:subtilisin family serine protease
MNIPIFNKWSCAMRIRTLIVCAALGVGMNNPSVAQQVTAPDFVPGELLVGFKSEAARESAIQDLKQTAQAEGFRGGDDATSSTVDVEPLDATSVRLRFNFVVTRGGAEQKPTKAEERRILEETAENLRNEDDRVEYAHPNWIFRVNRERMFEPFILPEPLEPKAHTMARVPNQPNDPVFDHGLHWHYLPAPKGMNAVGAWELGASGKDAVVAVLDTGILKDHPDIKTSGNLRQGYDFVGNDAWTGVSPGDGDGWDDDPTDPGDQCIGDISKASWHGTHVAGTIGAAATNNNLGIAAVGWKVSIVPVRVIGRCGGTIKDISFALRWAAGLPVQGVPANPYPADVINLSLGISIPCTPSSVQMLIDAINAANKAGVTIVAVAGNEDQDVRNVSPAGCANVVSVAAHDQRGHLAPYSNYGAVSIMAPGGDLGRDDDGDGKPDGVWSLIAPSSRNPDGVAAYEGTSMATPHVAAAIALAISKRPELRHKPDLIAEAVKAAAVPSPADACVSAKPCGPGQLDATKLVAPVTVAAPNR